MRKQQAEFAYGKIIRMRIIFARAATESLGLEYLSAVMKARGHEVSLVYEPLLFDSFRLRLPFFESESASRTARRILALNPGLVGFSVESDHFQWALSVARGIKRLSRVPVIFGGIHPTTAPEAVIALPEVDFICVADGESALPALAERLEEGQRPEGIANIWGKSGGAVFKGPVRLESGLDRLPVPDKELFFREYPGFVRDTYSIVTGRGCPNSCTYCHNNSVRRTLFRLNCPDRFLRRRGAPGVIAELAEAKKKYGFERVSFCDDLFISDKAWLKEFARTYPREIGLPFFCNIHPADADEEAVSLLAAAGCTVVNMGVQTVSAAIRRECLGRTESTADAVRALRLLKEAGIFAYTNFIFGLPGQDAEELKAVAAFAAENPAGFHDVNWLRYYPGAAILENARKSGLMSEAGARAVEEGTYSVPYGHGGHSYTPERARLRNMVFLASVLPGAVARFMLSRGLWRLLPAFSLRLPAVASRTLLARLKGNPNPYPNFSLYGSLRYFINYFFRYYAGAFARPPARAAKRLLAGLRGTLFLAGLLDRRRARRYLAYFFRRLVLRRRIPGMAVFAATFSCQCRCGACSSDIFRAKFGGKLMDRELALSRLGELAALGVPRIHFTGGESTLAPFLEELVGFCAGEGMTVFVESNGLGLTRERVSALKRSGLTCLNVSLDSARADEHDAARSAPGCHEAAVRALGLCRELGQPCMASCYATRRTAANGGLRRLIEAAASAGAAAVRVLPPVASGAWSGRHEELCLDDSDREAVLGSAWRAPVPVLDRTELIDCELRSAYKIMVLPDGGLAPCEHLPYVFRGAGAMPVAEVLDRAAAMPLFAKKEKCMPRSAVWLKAHPEASRGEIIYLDV